MIPRVTRASGVTNAVGAIAIAGLLGGCASGAGSTAAQGSLGFSEEPPVLTPEQQALLDRRTQREQELLARPLTAESAAEIALLHNPAVERALETLNMPGFDRLQLAHVVNPAFNGGRPPSSVETRIERPISVNAMTWVIVPALDTAGTTEERAARVQAADEIVALLFATRRAWVGAVAARQSMSYFEDVVVAVEAGREIMESMRRTGSSSELETLRAQRLYADALAQLTTAQVAAAVERERLVQTLGLWGADAERVQLPERFPELPRAPYRTRWPRSTRGRPTLRRPRRATRRPGW